MPDVPIIAPRVPLVDPRTGLVSREWYRHLTSQATLTSGSPVTRTNDSNVTLTLGGSPDVAALAPVSFTLGWTGQLPISRGGTGAANAAGALSALGGMPVTATTDDVAEGVTNLYYTTARAAAASPVQSVNGATGAVTLGAADVGAATEAYVDARGVRWLRAWSSSTAYVVGDGVSYGGSSWRALAANTNVTPAEGATWTAIALKGDTGATGPQGIQGVKGDTGPQGPTGATGPQGPTGPAGADGTNGADGKTVLNGSGAPAAGLGVDGDFYIDTTAEAIYGPKTSGAWGSATSLIGPQGATGATGPQGPAGPTNIATTSTLGAVIVGSGMAVDSDGVVSLSELSVPSVSLMDPDGTFTYGAGYPFTLARTGTATYINTAGTLSTAGDGVARIGLPYVKRRNLVPSSETVVGWGTTNASISAGRKVVNVPGLGDRLFDKVTATASGGYITKDITGLGNVLNRTFILSFYVVADSSQAVAARFSDTVTETSPTTSFTATTTVQRVSVPYKFASGTNTMLRLYLYANNGTSGTGTVYVYGIQLDEVATGVTTPTPYQATNSSGVDLANPINGAGLPLEGAGTNLYNQGDVTITNQTGFRFFNTITLAANTTYTVSMEISGVSGDATAKFQIDFKDSGGNYLTSVAGINLLQNSGRGRTAATFTTTSTTTNGTIYTNASTSYSASIVRFQIERSPFATSYTPYGTPRSPDLCGLTVPHNLLKWSEGFDNAAWSKGARVQVTSNQYTAPDGSMTADKYVISGSFGTNTDDDLKQTYSGGGAKTYTFSVWIKLVSGTLSTCRIFFDGEASSVKVIQVDANWQRWVVTFTTTGDPTPTIDFGNTASSAAVLAVWGAQLVEGSHPGPYVRTTDTAIPAPVDASAWPSWMTQNGFVEGYFILPGSSPPNLVTLGIFGATQPGVSTGELRLYRTSSAGSGTQQLNFDRKHNGSSGFSGTAGRGLLTTSATVYDGARHKFRIEWLNYSLNGVQVMNQRVYIDDVLQSSQDVAALYGATAWIAPERLWLSDGNVFATLSNVTIGRPSIPTGATYND